MVATNIRLPAPLHEQLRERSFRTRVSQNAIITRAVHLYLNAGNQESLDRWLAGHPVPGDPVPGEEADAEERDGEEL